MKCVLCNKEIKNYDKTFNHLRIDESHSADICADCIDKFTKWQAEILSNLFPTKTLKKRFEKSR